MRKRERERERALKVQNPYISVLSIIYLFVGKIQSASHYICTDNDRQTASYYCLTNQQINIWTLSINLS